MPEIMAGQSRYVSAPRKADRTRSAAADSRQTAETQMTDHLLRFVAETAVIQSPWAVEDDKIHAEAEGGDPEADNEGERSELAEWGNCNRIS